MLGCLATGSYRWARSRVGLRRLRENPRRRFIFCQFSGLCRPGNGTFGIAILNRISARQLSWLGSDFLG
jgi:hypothetical protein